ncbi:MAG: IMP dehydrogenase [Nanoarchaeota archaeon]|nr:IMP dehydrogenase [Nanoarchaeota archaeon]
MRLGLTFDDVLLVPKKTVLSSRSEADLRTYFTKNLPLSLPLVSSNMATVTEHSMAIALARVGGLGIIHQFNTIEEQVEEVKTVKRSFENALVGAALGVKDTMERAAALRDAGVDVLVLDVAHAHSDHVIKRLQELKSRYSIDVMVGNITTAEAAEELIAAGADGLKVGIGPSAVCTTRLMSGAGVPQLTAIMDVYSVAQKYNIPIAADGGMKHPGDATKALAAGASTIYSGSFFAGTDEAPGEIILKEGKKYKLYKGSASYESQLERRDRMNTDNKNVYVEGVSILVDYKGPVANVISSLVKGIQSGISYGGGRNIQELQEKAEFRQITTNGVIESGSRGKKMTE